MYDTDTDESTGTWDDWEQSSGCSRTCGGGILIGKSVTCISKSQLMAYFSEIWRQVTNSSFFLPILKVHQMEILIGRDSIT